LRDFLHLEILLFNNVALHQIRGLRARGDRRAEEQGGRQSPGEQVRLRDWRHKLDPIGKAAFLKKAKLELFYKRGRRIFFFFFFLVE